MNAQDNNDVVIVSAVRTPFSKYGGALREVSSIALAAFVFQQVLERGGVAASKVDEIYLGVGMAAEAALREGIVARQALLEAGFPEDTISLTIDRACCSSLTAVQLGYRSILLGEADVVIAGGAENMGRSPLLMPVVRWGHRVGDLVFFDPLYMLGYRGFHPKAINAVNGGEVALEYGVGREEQDAWALRSQQLYARAKEAGKFQEEIVPLPYRDAKGREVILAEDELPRPDTTLEKLATLPPVYGSPTVTAGNAPGLDTGASAVLLMRRSRAQALGLKPLARVLAVVSAADHWANIPVVPALAIRKALAKIGKTLNELQLVEINEAFAAMPLVSTKILGEDDPARIAALREKTNVNGGAIAVGHPVAASGTRILMTLIYELRRRGGGLGAAAICGGLAQGDAAVVEVPA